MSPLFKLLAEVLGFQVHAPAQEPPASHAGSLASGVKTAILVTHGKRDLLTGPLESSYGPEGLDPHCSTCGSLAIREEWLDYVRCDPCGKALLASRVLWRERAT